MVTCSGIFTQRYRNTNDGRSGGAIALQVKAETGTDRSVDDLAIELNQMVQTWKEKTYPTAWQYLLGCARQVYDPGYLYNPWGRKRRFPLINKSERRADLERQAFNFRVQSTVADTAQIAMDLIERYRGTNGLKFRIQNQVHDAIMLEVPKEEITICKNMFHEVMGKIDIPVGGTLGTLRLAVDVDVFTRWGEKVKD